MGFVKDTVTRSASIIKRSFCKDEEPSVMKQMIPEARYEDMLSVIELERTDTSSGIIIIDDNSVDQTVQH